MSKQSRARKASDAASPPVPNAFLVRWGALLASGIIVLTALMAYWNSFSGPFIFDDHTAILDNPTIRHLGSAWSPPHDGSGVAGRPLINFSLAVNYALGGFDVRGYHVLNLAIHILAALTLFGIVRRTLVLRLAAQRSEILRDTLPTVDSATVLALAVALLWAVHPLQTESVTCVIQRTESLMGLFYLLTLYGFIRYTDETGERPEDTTPALNSQLSTLSSGFRPLASHLWSLASVACCALGMVSKEVMVSAPLMVLLYDRTFVARTFRAALGRRWRYYAALASTWMVLGYLVISAGGSRGQAAGFSLGVTPWTYALTQCHAIIHYLKLSVWPHPLVLDYGTRVVPHLAEVLPQALVLVLLVVATIFGVWRRTAFGFVGAWFFAILAPSSSVVPLVTQTVAEHRMYLPLASVMVSAVLGLYLLLGRLSTVPFLILAAGLGYITIQRNQDYHSEVSIWSDTAAKCPDNDRARNDLGNALAKIPGRRSEAISAYEAALHINPDYVDAHTNLGNVLLDVPGRLPDAIAEYEAALRLNPGSAKTHNNLGNALLAMPGCLPDAIAEYEAALRIDPDYAEAYYNLGNALVNLPGRLPDAIAEYEAALRINPDYAEAHNNLGNALSQIPGRLPDAIDEYQAALRIKPGFPDVHYNLGRTLAQVPGRLPEAVSEYEAALRIKPDDAEAHLNLGNVLARIPGRLTGAIAEYQAALRIKPDYAEAHCNLGSALENIPDRLQDALSQYDEALRIAPGFLAAHYDLGLALMKIPNRRQDAIFHFEAALRIDPDFAQAREMLDRLQRTEPRMDANNVTPR